MSEEPPNRSHLRFGLIALLLVSCVLLLCAVQGILGYPFRQAIALDPAKFIPVEGYAYSASFSPQYSPWGRAISLRQTIRRHQGFFSIFATSDLRKQNWQGIFFVSAKRPIVVLCQ
jgi:hypothetical protein